MQTMPSLPDLPIAAIQLRPGHSHDSKALGRWQKTVWPDTVIAQPGWEHSRCCPHPLQQVPDPDPDETTSSTKFLARSRRVLVHTIQHPNEMIQGAAKSSSACAAQQPPQALPSRHSLIKEKEKP
jgi:hypothetical protein